MGAMPKRSGGNPFVVARNPDPASKLPYLIRLPLRTGDVVLKAREPWPRTAAVFCHPAAIWPAEPEILEQIPVRSCVRRGRAIDLVLDRGRENRSQIVFATRAGREMIFWQTPKTAARARPGVRLPARRASGFAELPILVDTRERYPFRFAGRKATVERRALPAGDYAVEHDGRIAAAVERKSIADLTKRLVDGSIGFLLGELAALPHAAVVVEDRYAKLFSNEHVRPGWVAELLAQAQVRYPSVPIVFCDTRKLAEEWTFRFLGAALAEAAGERFEEADRAAEEPPLYQAWDPLPPTTDR